MTPTHKAVREALRGARKELWDVWHSGMSEEQFNADPTIQDIDNAISIIDAETAGVGGAHPQIDGLDDAINNSVMYPMVNDVGFQSEHDRRVVMQAARRYLALTAPAEPEAEGDAGHLMKIIASQRDFLKAYSDGKYALYAMSDEVRDAAIKHLPCGEGPLDRATRAALSKPPAQPDKDLVAVNHELTWGDRGGGMYWQARCCNFTTIGNGGPYNTAEEAKEAARHGCNRMIAQTDKTGVV